MVTALVLTWSNLSAAERLHQQISPFTYETSICLCYVNLGGHQDRRGACCIVMKDVQQQLHRCEFEFEPLGFHKRKASLDVEAP